MDNTRIMIIFKPTQQCIEIAKTVSNYFKQLKIETESIWVDDFYRIENGLFDYIVIIGGDGTFLRLSRLLNKVSPLVLPIPCGRRLAFYENLDVNRIKNYLEMFLKGSYYIELIPRLIVEIEKLKEHVVNEVLISNVDQGRVGRYTVKIYSPSLSTQINIECDGVIVGPTPGSTAYNLSARGPFIDFSSFNIFVNFLNPVQLNIAPIVLPLMSRVEVIPESVSTIYADGERLLTKQGGVVKIYPSWNWIRVVRFKSPRDGLSDVLSKRIL
ncbi:NAD(+)/NADH kinase [Thermogladius sp. 4427co]|uniref:NAD(+)/NADH kinase n=1 Tax=Thermogladius sp. 4427co TaxID=3450718 RepID=UPI003F7A36F3